MNDKRFKAYHETGAESIAATCDADWDAVKSRWQHLEAEDPQATVFHSWEWQHCFWGTVLSADPAWSTWIVSLPGRGGKCLSLHGFSIKTLSFGPFRERSLYFAGSPHRDYCGGLYSGGRKEGLQGLASALTNLP